MVHPKRVGDSVLPDRPTVVVVGGGFGGVECVRALRKADGSREHAQTIVAMVANFDAINSMRIWTFAKITKIIHFHCN